MTPTISVVVTTYNRRELLKETLDSIQSQTFKDFELIVIDNFSDYDFFDFIASFNDSRIAGFQNANGGVIAINRNYGIRLAKGKFIALCDDDDLWVPGKLAEQLAVFQRFPDVSLVCTASSFINEPARPWYRKISATGLRAFLSTNIIPVKYLLLVTGFITNSSVVFRKEIVGEIGLLDENAEIRSVEDYDFWFRISQRHRIYFLNRKLVLYRMHAAQVSGENIADTKRKMARVIRNHWSTLDKIQILLFNKMHSR